jgi:hypothetical protein
VTDTGGANEGAKVEVSNVPSIRGGHGAQEAADGIVGSEAHGLRKKNQKGRSRRMKITDVEKSGNAGVISRRIDPGQGGDVCVGEIGHDCKLHLCGQSKPC